MAFNVGDRVRCVRSFNNRNDHGVVGQVYGVIHVDGEWHTLRGLDRQVSDARFELVERVPPIPTPPPEPENITERISAVRYVVMWCYSDEDYLNSDNWSFDHYIEEENAITSAAEKCEDDDYVLIGTKKLTLTFNVEI